MATLDSPDWEHVVTLVQPGGTVDCPDWQTQVTGPGGGTVPGTGGEPQQWDPGDWGFVGWSMEPHLATSSGVNTPTTGTILWQFMKAYQSATVNYIIWPQGPGAVTFTATENYVGIYTPTVTSGTLSSLTLVASSASGAFETAFAAAGNVKKVPLSSGYAVTAGSIYYVAFLQNRASGNLGFASQSNATNWNSYGWTYPWTVQTNNTHTTLPSPVTYPAGTLSSFGPIFFMAMST